MRPVRLLTPSFRPAVYNPRRHMEARMYIGGGLVVAVIIIVLLLLLLR